MTWKELSAKGKELSAKGIYRILYGILALAIVSGYIIPSYSSTEENPTGWAGSLAPLIALFTALIALLRSKLNAKLFPSPDILIGLGSLFTAHLWLADAEGIPPFSLEVLRIILLLAASGAILLIILLIILLLVICIWGARATIVAMILGLVKVLKKRSE